MHDWVEQLLKVQEKDIRIAKLQENVDAVPGDKAAVQESLRESRQRLDIMKTRVAEEEKRLKTLEIEAESLRAKQRDFESKSTMIKNNDEYRAALHQVELCRHKIAQFEDEELLVMEALEAARQALAEERKSHSAAEKRAEQMEKDLDIRKTNCMTQIAKLKAERDELATAVPAGHASRYGRIRQSRPGTRPVLVPVDHANICGGCHMNIPAQDRVNAARGQAVSCPNCGCLIYYANAVNQPSA